MESAATAIIERMSVIISAEYSSKHKKYAYITDVECLDLKFCWKYDMLETWKPWGHLPGKEGSTFYGKDSGDRASGF